MAVIRLAALLAGLAISSTSAILAAQSTRALTGATFAWREIDAIRVKGRGQPVVIYQPLGETERQSVAQGARAASCGEGLGLWRARDFTGAARCFTLCAETDPPSALFLARADRLARDPPPADWEPVRTLDEK